jgi:hypothetical protein
VVELEGGFGCKAEWCVVIEAFLALHGLFSFVATRFHALYTRPTRFLINTDRGVWQALFSGGENACITHASKIDCTMLIEIRV